MLVASNFQVCPQYYSHCIYNTTAMLETALRDLSLVAGRGGGLQNGRGGGHVKFYSYEKGGGGRKKF